MRLLLAAIALFALAAPASAVDFSDPVAVVTEAYSPYMSADFDWSSFDDSALRSAGLNALYAKDAEEAGGEIGRIDFDPLIDGQDYQINDLKIGEAVVEGDAATVTVTFNNFDQPSEMKIALVKEADGYKIDNVTSVGANPYDLREILTAPLE